MLSVTLTLVVSLGLAQAPAPSVNVACTILSAAQVTSMIGAAKTLPMTSAPNGSTCMFQNNDKVLTVFVATAQSPDGVKRLYDTKKAVASGTEIAGWGVPAYGGLRKTVATCGVLKQLTLTEVIVSDPTQTPDAITQKLQAAMRDFAARK